MAIVYTKTYMNLCQHLIKFFLDWEEFQIKLWRQSKHAAHVQHSLTKIVLFTI